VPQSLIQCEGVDGSRITYLPGDTCHLSNHNIGGEVAYAWVMLDRPAGSAAVLSNPAIVNPTFVVDVEGSYLLRLTVTGATGAVYVNQAVAAAKYLKTGMRVPAAGETTEVDSADGWASSPAVDAFLDTVNDSASDGHLLAGTDVAGGLSAGACVYISSIETLKAGLPGVESVPGYRQAKANVELDAHRCVGIVASDVAGGVGPFAIGAVILVRIGGISHVTNAAALGAAGDPIFLNDAGLPSINSGTFKRQIGVIVESDAATYADIFLFSEMDSVYKSLDTLYLRGASAIELTLAASAQSILKTGGSLQIGTSGANDLEIFLNGAKTWYFDNADSSLHNEQAADSYINKKSGDLYLMVLDAHKIYLGTGGASQWSLDNATGNLEYVGGLDGEVRCGSPTANSSATRRDYVHGLGFGILDFGDGFNNAGGGGVGYMGVCWKSGAIGATEADVQVPVPFPGYISNTYLHAGTAPAGGAGDKEAYAVRVNGVATGITFNLAVGGVTANKTGVPVAVVAGDLVSVSVTPDAGIVSGAKNTHLTIKIAPA